MAFALGPRALKAGYRLASYDQVGSTNAEALAGLRAGERGSMWFVTSEQTAGRGRRQRPWIAPRGNLACSVLEVLDIAPALAATLGFAAGLAEAAALETVSRKALRHGQTATPFRLKWPNDVLADGKKVVGISLDAEPVTGRLAVVVGFGTNVVAFPEGTPTPAVSLAALGIETSAEELFAALSDSWVEYFELWDHGRGFPAIRQLWLERAAGLGESVAVHMGKTTVQGSFETIDETGCLIVRTPDGHCLPVAAGDVYFGKAASAGAA